MNRIVFISCFLLLSPRAFADAPIEFNRDVRLILSDRCFACHGPDEQSREADLRLDDRLAATNAGAIVPGNADASELIRRIESTDESEIMPPPEHGRPLTAEEIKLLRRWIDQGAKYQQHWSFAKLARPKVPSLPSGQPKNPIDAFIRDRLTTEGLDLAEAADPRTLARRLSFDLTGLPPFSTGTLARDGKQVDGQEFPSYEALVDDLLRSPHFGERMAMYWLDLVRYADTLGYHGDQPRSVSPYRDYVIKAFNDNKPFDQFTTEQLAGDLIPNASLSQKVASTYNRLNRASGEGGVQPKEYLAKYSADRVRTTGAVWLGSTIGCAECHDHKFDPFTARDFYSFAAFFADIKEQGIVKSAVHIEKLPVPTAEQEQRLADLKQRIAETEKRFHAQTEELVEAQQQWEQDIRADAQRWTVLKPSSAVSKGNAKLTVLSDHSVLASETNPDRDEYVISGRTGTPARLLSSRAGVPDLLPDRVLLRIELLPHKSLPKSGPGRASNGNLVLHAVEMTIAGRQVDWQSAVASHSQVHHSPEYVINGHKHGWAILPRAGQPLQLLLVGRLESSSTVPVEKSPANSTEDSRATFEIRLRQDHGSGHNIGRFRLAASFENEADLSAAGVPDSIRDLVLHSVEKRSDQQKQQIEAAFRDSTPLLKEIRNQLSRLRKETDQIQKSIVTTLATTSTKPRAIRILPRGDWMDDSGEVVLPAVPEFLSRTGTPARHLKQTEERSRSGVPVLPKHLTRLDLAKWLTDRNNPLVARTFVNRLWMLMFGHGLARNVDDLGSQGEPPTHPELLDWLAMEFIDSGWDVKHMIRLMVTSETYMQSSRASRELVDRDPFNRLYARQSRWRLEAEMIRDNALAVSGLLNRQIGGVSAKPYQPAGYWAQLNFPRRTYQYDRGANQFRRGLYTHWQRTFLHPSLLAFDAPPREECTAQRSRSNTPLQSLVLLNDPTFVEAARMLATKAVEKKSSSFEARLRWITQQALMRRPRPDEVTLLKELHHTDLRIYQGKPEEARKLISIGETPLPENVDHADLAAWTSVTRAFLNLHESISRY